MQLFSHFPAEALHGLGQAIEGAGPWGSVGLLLAFVLGALVLAPRPLLCFLAGLSYGSTGLALALTGATVGAALAFWVGHRFARPIIRRFVEVRPKLRALTKAVEHEGWRAVLLFRLGPIVPSSVQSYLFGATGVSFWPYLGATLAGILPGIVMQVGAGALSRAALKSTLGPWQATFFAVGLGASVLAIVLIGRRARRLLDSQPLAADARSGQTG